MVDIWKAERRRLEQTTTSQADGPLKEDEHKPSLTNHMDEDFSETTRMLEEMERAVDVDHSHGSLDDEEYKHDPWFGQCDTDGNQIYPPHYVPIDTSETRGKTRPRRSDLYVLSESRRDRSHVVAVELCSVL